MDPITLAIITGLANLGQTVIKDAKNTHWKYSIITDNEEHAKLIEPGTPTPTERFEALRKLNELGVGGNKYLDFFAACYDIPEVTRRQLITDLLELVDLSHFRRNKHIAAHGLVGPQLNGAAKTVDHDNQGCK